MNFKTLNTIGLTIGVVAALAGGSLGRAYAYDDYQQRQDEQRYYEDQRQQHLQDVQDRQQQLNDNLGNAGSRCYFDCN